MQTILGSAVSPGAARGRAFVYTMEVDREAAAEPEASAPVGVDQHERIRAAISDVKHSLETDASKISRALNTASGDIFRAQAAIVQDNTVVTKIDQRLRHGAVDAEDAVREVFATLASHFRGSVNDALRLRGDDIEDLSRRLLLSLRGIHAHRLEGLPSGTILIVHHLYPSDTVFLSRYTTVGVIAEFAGQAAHAALLTREQGIPCIGGIDGIMDLIHDGDDIIIDGSQGMAFVDPDQETVKAYTSVIAEGDGSRSCANPIKHQPTISADGVEIAVMANARSLEDVEYAQRCGADGVGLFRTEPFFMACKHLPSAQELGAFLANSFEPLGGLRVNVRLLDIGADKNPTYLPLPPESDPFLGLRGVRVLLRYPDLLEMQLRALLDSSTKFNIGILIPMVSLESDVIEVVAACRRLAKDMGVHEIPPIGAMIETPAAALTVATLARHIDFLSIGSNDLTQYTLAAGRENPTVTDYFRDDHASVIRLIGMVVTEAEAVQVSLCGELAGRITAIPDLLRVGLRSLSVAPSLLVDVRRTIRDTSTRDTRT